MVTSLRLSCVPKLENVLVVSVKPLGQIDTQRLGYSQFQFQ